MSCSRSLSDWPTRCRRQSWNICGKPLRHYLPHCVTPVRCAIDNWLDAGAGCCALRHPELAALMQETLLQFDGQRYRLAAWCVMPNHVHVLIEPRVSLAKIVQSWKSYTGRWAMARNAELGLGVPGDALWMRDYWDRYIRNQQHLDAVTAYIHQDPVAAGLCRMPQDWQWSSACRALGSCAIAGEGAHS